MDNHEEECVDKASFIQGALVGTYHQPAIRITIEEAQAGGICKTFEFATKEDYEHYKKLDD